MLGIIIQIYFLTNNYTLNLYYNFTRAINRPCNSLETQFNKFTEEMNLVRFSYLIITTILRSNMDSQSPCTPHLERNAAFLTFDPCNISSNMLNIVKYEVMIFNTIYFACSQIKVNSSAQRTKLPLLHFQRHILIPFLSRLKISLRNICSSSTSFYSSC